jgi:4-amino-4-deoxy-L-arabinose transferase-like glycosyltransferase
MSTPAQLTLDRRIGWGLFLGAFVLLLSTEKAVGFTRDESVYFQAGESYARWWELLVHAPTQALGDDAITRSYEVNHEHPALMKNAFGISERIFSEGLGLVRPATGFRLPAFAMAALLLPLIYALARRLFGRPAAVFAAVSFFLVPRQFYHAHLSCFDVPITTAWVLVVYAFLRALEEKRWWVYTGLLFGAALATKHNAFFLVPALVPFSLWRGTQASAGKPEARTWFTAVNAIFVFAAVLAVVLVLVQGLDGFQRSFQLLSPQVALFLAAVSTGGWALWRLFKADETTFRAVAPLWAMAALGPVVFYLHWPYLWHHPVDRTAQWISFHATHNHYTWYYLGQLLREPPFPLDYVVVLTGLTVPSALFVPMVAGFLWVLVRLVRRQTSMLEVVVLVNAVTSIALISAPNVPHFGGVKHWFPSMPFLAVLAAGSVWRGAQALQARWPKVSPLTAFVALAVLIGASGAIATARVYEYGTAAYSEAAGGLPGAASLGMQRQYWSNNVTGVLTWLNANTHPGERVYLHEVHGGQVHDMQRNGMLRRDLSFVGSPWDADVVAYQYHQEFREIEFNTWQAMGTRKPVYGLYVDETPQVVVYRRTR